MEMTERLKEKRSSGAWGCLGQVSISESNKAFDQKPGRKRVDRKGLAAPDKATFGRAKVYDGAPPPALPAVPKPSRKQAAASHERPTAAGAASSTKANGDAQDDEVAIVDGSSCVPCTKPAAAGTKPKRVFKFSETWKVGRGWLKHGFADGTARMWCTACVSFFATFAGHTEFAEFTGSPYIKSVWESPTIGCRTIRLEKVVHHERSNGAHAFAVRALAGDGAAAPAAKLSRTAAAQEADTTDENRPFFAMFHNAFVIAANNLAAMVFPAMNDADHRKGTPTIDRQVNAPPPPCAGSSQLTRRYNSDMQCADFILHLSKPLREKQTAKLQRAPKLAFAIDESTDVSHTSEMIIYTQYADVDDDFKITLEHFEMVECKGGTAPELFETVCGAVKRRGKALFDKWIAFASDGPTVMVGAKNSVTQRLKVVKPWLVDQHCVGHREPLAAKDAFDSVSFCSKLDEVVHACGNFYSH